MTFVLAELLADNGTLHRPDHTRVRSLGSEFHAACSLVFEPRLSLGGVSDPVLPEPPRDRCANPGGVTPPRGGVAAGAR